MHTPRFLILAIVLTSFALLGAQCGPKEPDEDPLPQRAGPATPFLRTYYRAQTFPRSMKAIKIPEGPDFEDDELKLSFDMAGNELVTDVDVAIMVAGDNAPSIYDLQCRVVSPVGTVSGWKPVDLLYTKSHVPFLFEFDSENSSGRWEVQLRDPFKDNDGRLRMRNVTLRINDGESTTIRGTGNNANETVTLTGAQSNFGIINEASVGTFPWDFGRFGVNWMLQNNFTFTQSFSVRLFTLTFALLVDKDVTPDEECLLLVMAPSGGFAVGTLKQWLEPGSLPTPVDLGSQKQFTITVAVNFDNDLFAEPSLGTWTMALVDLKPESHKTMQLNGATALSMTLQGRTYT